MNLLEYIFQYLTPDSCLGCGTEDSIMCDDCSASLSYPDRCFACNRPSTYSLTCARCKPSPINAQAVVCEYSGLGKGLVTSAKYQPSRSAARAMGLLLASKIPYLEAKSTLIVPVPTTSSRVRQRGFDQSVLMAQSISKTLGLKHNNALFRLSSKHQVGSGKKARIEHMSGAFRINDASLIKDKIVVLVDDVVTTGSTMMSAAKVCKNAGASRVVAAYFARTI